MGWVLLSHVLGSLHYLSKRSALRQHLVLRARQKIVMQTIREETARRPFASYLHPFPFTSYLHPFPFASYLPPFTALPAHPLYLLPTQPTSCETLHKTPWLNPPP